MSSHICMVDKNLFTNEQFFKIHVYLNSLPNGRILDWSKLKTLADDKIIITQEIEIIFSISHNFFKRLLIQDNKNQGLFGKGLIKKKKKKYFEILFSRKKFNIFTDKLSDNFTSLFIFFPVLLEGETFILAFICQRSAGC